jgi:tagatose-1,6-bisphosphate aldolase non-catalytic subunit AgaZ/GatZ
VLPYLPKSSRTTANSARLPTPLTFSLTYTQTLQAHAHPLAVRSHAMTYHFPDAYAGTNTYREALEPAYAYFEPHVSDPKRSRKIRDTLNNLILKSPQNWQTSVGLPL